MSFSVSANSWETDVNVSDNTSIAHVQVTITTSGDSHSNYDHYGTIVIDGQSYSHGPYRLPYTTTKTFESTRKITHNNDGTKSINWSYSFPVKSDSTRTGSGTLTLTTIPRASQPRVSVTSVNLGTEITIYTDKKANFTHTITYSIGSASGTIGQDKGVVDSVKWTPPATLANQFPNAKSGIVTITCKTYSGNTLIGSKTCTLTVNTINNGTYQPSITMTVTGSNLFNGNYLNKVSGVTVSATPTGKYSARINSYTIAGPVSTSANTNLVVNPINLNISSASQSATFTCKATDSRGYEGTKTTNAITIYRYNVPTINQTETKVQRCAADGSLSTSGTYAKVTIKYTYQNDGYGNNIPTEGLVIKINGVDYKYSSSDFTEATENGVVTGIGAKIVGGGSLTINTTYNWTITCTDAVGKSVSFSGTLPTSERIINVRPQGKGIAFGKFAEQDNLLDSAWKIKSTNGFEGNASSATNATNTNVTNTNPDSGTWYYPTFVSGTSGNQAHRVNNGFRNHLKKGTTSVVGESYLSIGNATASGTANNERGFLQIYGPNTGRAQLEYKNTTTNAIHTLPAISGTYEIQRAMAWINYGRATMSNLTAWGAGKALTTVASSKTIGSGLTISNGQIVVNNSTIKKVKITGSIQAFRNTSNGDTGARIRKNNNTNVIDLTYTSYNSTYQYWTSGNSVTLLYDVSQNDKINIWVWSGAASSVEYLGAALLVEDVTEY